MAGDPGGPRLGRLYAVFAPWLARHLRREKRKWHAPSHEPVRGGWTIGSSKNGSDWPVSLFQW